MPTTVYALCDPCTLEIRYVGQTTQNVHKRIHSHVRDCKMYNHHASKWINKMLNEHGYIDWMILEKNAEYNTSEQKWIKKLRESNVSLTNSTDGGGGTIGWKQPQHVKDAVSKAHKGQIISEEHKEIVRKKMTGRVVSEQSRVRLSNSLKGRVFTKEHIENINKAHIKECKSFICNETKIVYNSTRKAAKLLGLSRSTILDILKHRNGCTKAKGMTFKYIEEKCQQQ